MAHRRTGPVEPTPPAVSVVICAYTLDRWSLLETAVASVRAQSQPPAEIVVVVDHNPALRRRAAALGADLVMDNDGPAGLAGARNSGVAVASAPVLAFLDDDAEAEPTWLANLCRPYADDRVVGVGGLVEPLWAGGRPGWFPVEFDWVVGCSYRGLPPAVTPIRNPIGANMSFRADAVRAAGGFATHLGRIGTVPLGCEETELAIRIARHLPDSRVMFAPDAVVRHHVPAARGRWSYFRRRCWAEGLSKAEVARLSDPRQALSAERDYVTRTLPTGVLRGLRDGVLSAAAGRRPVALARAATIAAGLAVTTAGYVAGRAHQSVAAPMRPDPKENRMASPTASNWLHFDVHGRAGLRVDAAAPAATQLSTILRGFATESPVDPDIVVSAPAEPMPEASRLEEEFRYTDGGVMFPGAQIQVVHDSAGWRIHGPGELLTALVPVLDRCLVERGTAMIHAATVAYRGIGVALPAAGGTGKTSVIAKLTRRRDFAFMGDDWAFLGDDGSLLAFEKPMFIKPHHRPIYPHLFTGARKPLVPKLLSRPVGRLTTLAHPYVVRRPRLADMSRRWSPEHRIVEPRQALPDARFAAAAPLGLAMYCERYDGARTRLLTTDAAWMVDRMIGNFHIELPSFSQRLITALGASSVVGLLDHFRDKSEVLHKALEGIPCYVLRVPSVYPADRASDEIVAVLDELLPAVEGARSTADSPDLDRAQP